MSGNQLDVENVLKSLFDQALSGGALEYIFALVRVEGLTFGIQDPLRHLHSILEAQQTELADEELQSQYCSLTSMEEPLALVANLLRCSRGQPYKLSPFHDLYSGQFPNIIRPTPSQVTRDLIRIAGEAEKPEIAELIGDAYVDEILVECESGSFPLVSDRLRTAFGKCHSFLTLLLRMYFRERLRYRDQPKLYKLPNFMVLELLVNDEFGLYGFRMHFSNGTSSLFARHPDSTECTNFSSFDPIGFHVGLLDELRDEWRIGEKRLYEIGLPGRYNEIGKWKPIIYPGNYDPLEKEALTLSEDDDVRGTLLYIMCTGHRGIEFVVRTSIELPRDAVSFGEKFHLWKCPRSDDEPHHGQNVRIYDGWLEVDSVDPEYLRSAIAMIGVAVNRMAFAYEGAIDWRVKYRMTLGGGGYATPSEEDLHVLDSILRKFPRTEDAFILDAAIDWFNRGRSSQNVFTAFLCYYIALESVAIEVADGHAELGLGYSQESRVERLQRVAECIRQKHESLYSEEPVRFIEEAYFDCILSLREKTRRIAELVFGPEHSYLKALFEKRDGHSLSDIRGKLAHGRVTLIDKENESLVRSRVHEIAEISRKFLTRIIFLLNPNDPLPSWSRRHVLSIWGADPRTIMVATTHTILPNTDWKIRPEWCE